MPRPKTHDETLRLRLLDRAGELLVQEGAKALSLRRLAADAETSTTAVYSLFGSKPDLVNAVYVEGFTRFGTRLREVAGTDDPAEDVVRIGLAYRDAALADRHLYSVMFTGAVPGFEPNGESSRLALRALEPLWDAVGAGLKAGVFADVDVETIAVGCWACVHGLVSLELNTGLARQINFCQTYERSLRATVDGWRR
ncbi:TetR/AcrR family transcriptional regulator [Prauserella muralis]|uniref:TetR family transcriptional regulator n=1 Tax=Prauserella muralis TaxID=588067 RepID=A0A2V4BAN4_9PSEU|nr:TetR/AcrR family transcriptional regulator [Prauserella muralis]PXY32320.1 TetR family transcriptional regulator [Prauserella muralis]TWE24001.1 TetR family transcriptional regulator [Prauserella muralis]